MDFAELYHFLFETIEGIGCLIVACLVRLGVRRQVAPALSAAALAPRRASD